jgi:UDP-N-acetylmuramoyl-tripeptide--D-alanyl-D-alanine ligase
MSTHSKPTLITALAILQQSEYDCRIFLDWWNRNQSKAGTQVEPDQWTPKLKLIFYICSILFFVPTHTKVCLASKLARIPEWFIATYKIHQAVTKLRRAQKNGLVVVAVAGSYAKTSTKHWVYHLLQKQVSVLHTDKSINTPLGIAQTISTKLTKNHQLFIVELGEYYQGDITKLAKIVNPDYGIVTPIGHQHLERMHTITAIAQTIGELVTYFVNKKQTAKTKAAQDIPVLVAAENKPHFDSLFESIPLKYYGIDSKNMDKNSTPTKQKLHWAITSSSVSRSGTEVAIQGPSAADKYSFFTPLYGAHQATNALPAFWLAQELANTSSKELTNVSLEKVAQAAATMPYIPQRHQPHFAANDVLILDNSYNTNPESFAISLALINELKPSKRFVITLGFVELGSATETMHQELGKQLAKNADYVGIIDSQQAVQIQKSFEAAGGKPSTIVIADSPEACMAKLQPHVVPGSVILFEGGYREVLV